MAKVRVAVNGFGRIGRNIVRAIFESGRKDIDVVAINDLGPVETNAHLLRYDSVHGRFPHEVKVEGDMINIGTEKFKVCCGRTTAKARCSFLAQFGTAVLRHPRLARAALLFP